MYTSTNDELTVKEFNIINKNYLLHCYGLDYICYRLYGKHYIRVRIREDKRTIFNFNTDTVLWEEVCDARLFVLYNTIKDVVIPKLLTFRARKMQMVKNTDLSKKEMDGIFKPLDDQIKYLQQKKNTQLLINCIAARSLVEFANFEINKDPDEIATGDKKIYNFRTGETRARTNKDFFSWCVPAKIVKDTKIAKTYFRSLTSGDKETSNALITACGYCLTGHTSEKIIIVLYGPNGDDGKSCLANILMLLLNKGCREGRHKLLFSNKTDDNHTAHLDCLRDTRLVFIREPKLEDRLDETSFKKISGGDPISGRKCKGEEEYNFMTQARLFVITNNPIKYPVVDKASRRRILGFPMNNHFEKSAENVAYIKSLENEHLDAIFSLLANAIHEHFKSGLPLPRSEAMMKLSLETVFTKR